MRELLQGIRLWFKKQEDPDTVQFDLPFDMLRRKKRGGWLRRIFRGIFR